jgi:tetratricopeptide (TPR) repeat protein
MQDIDPSLCAEPHMRTLLSFAIHKALKHGVPVGVWKNAALSSSRTQFSQANKFVAQVYHPPDLAEAKWAAGYANSLLYAPLHPLETALIKHEVQQLFGSEEYLDLPFADKIATDAFEKAISFKLHGDWLLHLESANAPFDQTTRRTAIDNCRAWNIVPCESSAQAYEFARCILTRLKAIYKDQPPRAAYCDSLLATVYAGMGKAELAHDATNRVHALVYEGARFTHNTVKDVCDMLLKAVRFDEAEAYCSLQASFWKDKKLMTYAREQKGHALYCLARMYSQVGEIRRAQSAYTLLLSLFEEDKQTLYEYKIKYAEFLFRTEDHFAESFLKETLILGGKVGALNAETADRLAKRLRKLKGNRKFE